MQVRTCATSMPPPSSSGRPSATSFAGPTAPAPPKAQAPRRLRLDVPDPGRVAAVDRDQPHRLALLGPAGKRRLALLSAHPPPGLDHDPPGRDPGQDARRRVDDLPD